VRALYAEQLAALARGFDLTRVHVSISECMQTDPLHAYNRIYRFLGAPTLAPQNRTHVFSRVSHEHRTNEYYEPFAETLAHNHSLNGTLHRLFRFYHSSTAWTYRFLGGRVNPWDEWYAHVLGTRVQPLSAVGHEPCARNPQSELFDSCQWLDLADSPNRRPTVRFCCAESDCSVSR
jgi:hypothetical protein